MPANKSKSKKILITGAAGFIGYQLCERLLAEGFSLVGLDNLNAYYDVQLKKDRLRQLGIKSATKGKLVQSEKYKARCQFIQMDLDDKKGLTHLFEAFQFEQVCNLAAQAGVRYSLENPKAYVDSNIVGFVNLLECMRHAKVKKLVYASSSSIYGNQEKTPFSTTDNVDHPISLYAATKKSNELMAYTYTHLFGIESVGLRFFTVYGPWGRPDMAMFLFTDAIVNAKPLKIFNHGKLSRDFTYIDDIVNGVFTVLVNQPLRPYSLYNIGKGSPVKLMDFITTIEQALGKKAIKEMLPMQPGDVEKTWADTTKLEKDYNYRPETSIGKGVNEFIRWYKSYYKP